MEETQEKAQVAPVPEHVRGQLTTATLALAQAAHCLRASTPSWRACMEAMAAVERVHGAWGSAGHPVKVEGDVRVTVTGTREGVVVTFHAPGRDGWGVRLSLRRARALARELLCEADWCADKRGR